MMQRRTLTVFITLFAITFLSSCVREYTCQCKISFSGSPGLPDSLTNEYIIKDNLDNAKSLCEGASSTYTDQQSGITTTEACKIF